MHPFYRALLFYFFTLTFGAQTCDPIECLDLLSEECRSPADFECISLGNYCYNLNISYSNEYCKDSFDRCQETSLTNCKDPSTFLCRAATTSECYDNSVSGYGCIAYESILNGCVEETNFLCQFNLAEGVCRNTSVLTTPGYCMDLLAYTVCKTSEDICISCADVPSICGNGIVEGLEECDNVSNVCCTSDCLFASNHTVCGSSEFCDGINRCDGNGNCILHAQPVCDDHIDCTTDICDEEIRGCRYVANNSFCDDGVWCNGQEVCSCLSGECHSTQAPCTAFEFCVEKEQLCVPSGCTYTAGFWKDISSVQSLDYPHLNRRSFWSPSDCSESCDDLRSRCENLTETTYEESKCVNLFDTCHYICVNPLLTHTDAFFTTHPKQAICTSLFQQYWTFVANLYLGAINDPEYGTIGAHAPAEFVEYILGFDGRDLDFRQCEESELALTLAHQLDLFNRGMWGIPHCDGEISCVMFSLNKLPTQSLKNGQTLQNSDCNVYNSLLGSSACLSATQISSYISSEVSFSLRLSCQIHNQDWLLQVSTDGSCKHNPFFIQGYSTGDCIMLGNTTGNGASIALSGECVGCIFDQSLYTSNQFQIASAVENVSTNFICVESRAYWQDREDLPTVSICGEPVSKILKEEFSPNVRTLLTQQVLVAYLNILGGSAHASMNSLDLSAQAFLGDTIFACYNWAYREELPKCLDYNSSMTDFQEVLQCAELLAEFNEGLQNVSRCNPDLATISPDTSYIAYVMDTYHITLQTSAKFQPTHSNTVNDIGFVLGATSVILAIFYCIYAVNQLEGPALVKHL